MSMDPQQRLALEVAYEAMQQGLSATAADTVTTGSFVGECSHDFTLIDTKAAVGPFSATGGASSITANRISHAFGLR
eukprot:2846261-Rhodomonas_salina.1